MNRLRMLLPLALGAAGQAIPSSAHARIAQRSFGEVENALGAEFARLSVRTTHLRVQTERLAQRINLNLALGGGFGPPAMAAVATQ